MRRSLLTTRSTVGLGTVGDSASASTGDQVGTLFWNTGPTSTAATASGTLSRFRVNVFGTGSRTFAFFTINPTTDVVTAITATITATLAAGVNEFVTTPIAVNAGDLLGVWGGTNLGFNSRAVAGGGTLLIRTGTSATKPTAGTDITSLWNSAAANEYMLLSATPT